MPWGGIESSDNESEGSAAAAADPMGAEVEVAHASGPSALVPLPAPKGDGRRGRKRGAVVMNRIARASLEELAQQQQQQMSGDAPDTRSRDKRGRFVSAPLAEEEPGPSEAIAVAAEPDAPDPLLVTPSSEQQHIDDATLTLSIADDAASPTFQLGLSVRRFAQSTGPPWPGLFKVAEALLLPTEAAAASRGRHRHQSSSTVQGAWLGIDRTHLTDGRKQAAAGHVLAERAEHETFLRLLKAQEQEGIAKPVAYFERVCFDETPLRARVEEDKGVAKLVQSELEWAALVQYLDTGRFVQLRGTLSTWAQAIDRNTAECLQASLEDLVSLPKVVENTFPRRVRIFCADDYSGNNRALRSWNRGNPEWSLLRSVCQVHKSMGVCKQTTNLVQDDITGLLRAMLSISQVGSMREFRQHMENIIDERLEITHEPPPSGLQGYRAAVLDAFCVLGKGPQAQWKRYVVPELANGDWTLRGKVVHHEVGCCKDEAHTRHKFRKYLVPALLQGLRVFTRSKWTGFEEVVDAVALAESVHGLFSATFLHFAGAKDNGDPAMADELGEPGDNMCVAEDIAAGGSTDWKQIGVSWLRYAVKWVEAAFLPRLIIMRVVGQGRRLSLDRMLQTSSFAWERKQQSEMSKSGERLFRALLRYDHWYTEPAMDHYGSAARDLVMWLSLPEPSKTSELRCLAFRLLSRAACVTHQNLVAPERMYPFKQLALHGLAGDASRALAAEIINEPRCCMDEYTQSVLETFPSVDALLGAEASAERLTVLSMTDLCIARLEAKHARVRRLSKVASLQARAPDLESISAAFVGTGVRQHREFTLPREVERKSDESSEVAAAVKPQRAFSAWQAFVHSRTRSEECFPEGSKVLPNAFGTTLQNLAREFRELGADGKRQYEQLARMADLRRSQGLPAFEVRGTRLQRAIRASDRLHLQQVVEEDTQALAMQLVADGGLELEELATKLRLAGREKAKHDHLVAQAQERDRVQPGGGRVLQAAAESMAFIKSRPAAFQSIGESTAPPMAFVEHLHSANAKSVADAIASREPGAAAMRQALLSDWAYKHRLIRHREQEAIGKLPPPRQSCALFGHCVCQRGRNSEAFHFSGRLQSIGMAGAPADLVDLGLLVLCLVRRSDSALEQRLWLHVGFIFRRRRPTFWVLEGPQSDKLPERFFVRPTFEDDGSPLVRTCFGTALGLDLTRCWEVAFFRLAPSMLPLLDVKPSELEVEAVRSPDLFEPLKVWPPPTRRRRGRRAGPAGPATTAALTSGRIENSVAEARARGARSGPLNVLCANVYLYVVHDEVRRASAENLNTPLASLGHSTAARAFRRLRWASPTPLLVSALSVSPAPPTSQHSATVEALM